MVRMRVPFTSFFAVATAALVQPIFAQPRPTEEFGNFKLVIERSLAGTGTLRLRDPSGKDLLKGNVVGGRPNGIWTRLDSTGRKIGDYPYADGALDGTVTQKYRSGRTARVYRFKKGHPHGSWEAYREDGKLEWRYYFLDGLLENSLRLRYRNICTYTQGSPSYCKSAEQAQHDLGTFLPPGYVDAFLQSLNDVFDLRGLSTDADTLIACGKSGVAAVTLGAPPENAPASGRRPREGLAAGGLSNLQQAAQDRTVGDACGAAHTSGSRSPGNPGRPGDRGLPGSDSSDLVQAAEGKMDQAIKSCHDSTAETLVSQGQVVAGEAAWPFLKGALTEVTVIAAADVVAGQIDEATSKGFSDDYTQHGTQKIYAKVGDPNTQKIVDDIDHTTRIVTKELDGNVIETTYYDREDPAGPGAGHQLIAQTVEKDSSGKVVRTETLTVHYAVDSDGNEIFSSYTRDVTETDANGNVTTVHQVSNDGGKTWVTQSRETTPAPPTTTPATGASAGGAGMPADSGDRRSRCQKAEDAWESFKAFCEQSHWQIYKCQSFLARMNNCPDPALINISPEGDPVCRARTTGSADDRRKADCERRKLVELVAPGGSLSCDLPKINLNPLAPGNRNICNDPRAMCAPDGIVDLVSKDQGPLGGDRPAPRPGP
jgi:hypothetical protein